MTKDRWRELRRPVVRMRDALALGQLTVAGEPLTSVTARKLGGYVKFGPGEKYSVIAKDIMLLVLALVAIFAFMTAVPSMFNLAEEQAHWFDAALGCAIALAVLLRSWWKDRR